MKITKAILLATARGFFWCQFIHLVLLIVNKSQSLELLEIGTGIISELIPSLMIVSVILFIFFFVALIINKPDRKLIFLYYGLVVFLLPLLFFITTIIYYSKSPITKPMTELEAEVLALMRFSSAIVPPIIFAFTLGLSPSLIKLSNKITGKLSHNRKEEDNLAVLGFTFLLISVLLSSQENWCIPGSSLCKAHRSILDNTDECQKMHGIEAQFSCWNHIASLAKSNNHCLMVPGDLGGNDLLNSRDYCYSNLARKYKNVSLCEMVKYEPSAILCKTFASLQ